MYFIDDVSDLADRIGNDEVLLGNAGECWVFIASAKTNRLPEKLKPIHHPLDNPAMLLVPSIEEFKSYVPELHPRVETLLSLHQRPLGLYFDDSSGPFKNYIDSNIHVVRLAQDPLLLALMDKLSAPLLLLDVMDELGDRPRRLAEISSNILEVSDHTLRYKQEEILKATPCILARYNRKGELDFIRE